MNHYYIRETVKNGDCFFDSIRIVLAAHGIELSIQELRHLVAIRIFDSEEEVVIRTWLEIAKQAREAKDYELSRDYAHLESLVHSPLSPENLDQLYEQMMRPSYWGDEFAIRQLEETLAIQILILNGNADLSKPKTLAYSTFRKKKGFSHCMVLCLKDRHYTPVFYKEEALFEPQLLPRELLEIFHEQIGLQYESQNK